ncbi:MAG: methylenetetrahydrofolate reductase C-terminal domain-containing protein [Sulfolobales archaeon]
MNTCPKRMINGPCGGYRDVVCEDDRLKCVWILAYYSALKRGTIDKMFQLKLDPGFRVSGYRPVAKRARGVVERILSGRTAIIYEYTPKPYTSPSALVEELREIANIYHGVDFVDNPGGYPIPSSLPYAMIAKNSYRSLHVSMQITARNRDRNQVVSDVLAASLAGLDAIVATTGDLQVGEKGVWDLDAPRLIYLARLVLDLGIDHMGRRVGIGGEGMIIAASVNINAEPLKPEILKIRVKMDAGAELFITQPVFNVERYRIFQRSLGERVRNPAEIPIMIGIIPITSRKIMQFFQSKVGIKIPEKILVELKKDKIDREALTKANLDIIERIVREINHSSYYISAFGDHRLGVEIAKVVRGVVG